MYLVGKSSAGLGTLKQIQILHTEGTDTLGQIQHNRLYSTSSFPQELLHNSEIHT